MGVLQESIVPGTMHINRVGGLNTPTQSFRVFNSLEKIARIEYDDQTTELDKYVRILEGRTNLDRFYDRLRRTVEMRNGL